ncbi:MAG: rhomboid family intramembrane serine protease [Limisphaerales bacterium]
MLDDRDYMRDGSRREPLPWSVKLLIALVVCFALQCINDVYLKSPVERWLAMTTTGLQSGHVWQLFTFQFLHADFLHLLFNGIALWFFGRWVEFSLGRHRFAAVFLITGAAGALRQGARMLALPRVFGPAVVGASAGVSGLFAVFAWLEAESEVRWNFILPIKARTLFWIYVAIEAFVTLVPTERQGGVAHAAHLGGLLMGMQFVRLGWHRDYVALPWENWFKRKPKAAKRGAAGVAGFELRSPAAEEPLTDDFISKEVDPILDKISAHGIHSLTERERKILEKARSVMAKRS